MKKRKAINYRTGGVVMMPFVTLGNVLASHLKAPWYVFGVISLFGYVTAIILILKGNQRTKGSEEE